MGASSQGSGLWAEAFRVERAGVDPRAGAVGAFSTCAPLALGIATGHDAIGSIACFGGLNACLAVPRGPLRTRVGWGVGAGLGCVLAVVVTTLAQDSTLASVLVALAWVWLAALMRAFGRDGGLTGFVTSAMLVIIGGIPAGGLDVGARTLWFAAGATVGTVLMALAYGTEPDGGARGQKPRAAERPIGAVLAAGLRRYLDTALHDHALRVHALRLAVAVAATTLLYRLLGLEHGYWIPLTVLAVLQPDEHASRVRAIQRGLGTLFGTALIALLTTVTGAQWALVAAQAIVAFALFTLADRGYFWLVVFLTPVALLTVSAVDYQGADIALVRAGWSAAGIACGLVVGELAWQLAPALTGVRGPWGSAGTKE
jgi:hypothetical protein